MGFSLEGFHIDNIYQDRIFEIENDDTSELYQNISRSLADDGQRLSIGMNAYYDSND